jgi:hypothetical protein
MHMEYQMTTKYSLTYIGCVPLPKNKNKNLLHIPFGPIPTYICKPYCAVIIMHII